MVWLVNGKLTPNEGANGAVTTDLGSLKQIMEKNPFPERGRYRLILSPACGFSHRSLISLVLSGLGHDTVPVDVVSPLLDPENSWQFAPRSGRTGQLETRRSSEGLYHPTEDGTGSGAKYLHQVYEKFHPGYTGRITVPLLVDTKGKGALVSNTSFDLAHLFMKWGAALAEHKSDNDETSSPHHGVYIDPVPELEDASSAAAQLSARLEAALVIGSYKCAKASTQEEYDKAVDLVFKTLDEMEDRLSKSRFLIVGTNRPSLVDWQVFPTLVRFDAVYHTLFKCSRRRLKSYANISEYVRDLYQTSRGVNAARDESVASTVIMGQIRMSYFSAFTELNPKGVIPIGNDPGFDRPHSRQDRFTFRESDEARKLVQDNRMAVEDAEVGSGDEKEAKRAAGLFIRGVSGHRATVRPEDAVRGRYHLYIANNCPWCHRVMLARAVLGLEDVISVDVAFYRRDQDRGWQFLPPDDQLLPEEIAERATLLDGVVSEKDSVFGFQFVPEIYEREGSKERSVPILFDKKTKKIVNNESAEIIRIFNSAFSAFHRKDAPNLYPPHLAAEIEKWNSVIYPNINNGAYKAGFTSSQEAYEEAFNKYFATLDDLDEHLQKKRFLTGETVTEADLRLYPTLKRHDRVYYSRMRLDKKMIVDYPYLHRWLLDMDSQAGVARATNLEHCIRGYFGRTGNNLIPSLPPSRWY